MSRIARPSVLTVLSTILCCSPGAHAESCYTLEGEAKTINVSATAQLGTVELVLLDLHDQEAFRETGQLVGTITGQTLTQTFLSHTANFEDESSFVTSGDAAYFTGVRAAGEDGNPCSFFVRKYVTEIVEGAGFF